MSKWVSMAQQRKRGAIPPHLVIQAPPPPAQMTPPPPPSQKKVWVPQGGTGPIAALDEELERIFSLPVLGPDAARCPNPEEYAKTLYHHAKPSGFSLRPGQIDGAYIYEKLGGALIPLGVGKGKTIISILCAKIGLERRGHQRVAIMVPTEVFGQLVTKDLPQARSILALDGIHFYPVEGSAAERQRICRTPGPGVWIYTYSSLSTETGYEELAAIAPTLYICDEAHCLSRPTTARTKRWKSVVHAVEELCIAGRMGKEVRAKRAELVALSGTITKKQVEDYAHLAHLGLRGNSPAPIRESAIAALGACINADAGSSLTEVEIGRLRKIISWAEEQGYAVRSANKHGVVPTFQESVRAAYQVRLRSCPGVISSSDLGVEASLVISWSEPHRPNTAESERMVKLMTDVITSMVTPDGDVIDYGMHTYKWLWELSAGFYNSLIWPTLDLIQKYWANQGKVVDVDRAGALLQAAKDHHAMLQEYHKKLRKFLDRGHFPGCDTPMLVAAEIVRQRDGHGIKHPLPRELVEAYWAQRDMHYDDLPKRYSVPVRVCDYRVRAVVKWCEHYAKKGGLVWFHHPEVGLWIHELLVEAGIPHTCAFAGDNEAAYAPGIVITSFAHHIGKNLQHQRHNLFAELRREASVMEQTIGRTHRSGQMADCVTVDVIVSNGFDLAQFNATLKDADYIQSTTGTQQRLCYATYSPVVPPTSPRLAVKLGIIKEADATASPNIRATDTITPTSALEWSSMFRSANVAPPVKSK